MKNLYKIINTAGIEFYAIADSPNDAVYLYLQIQNSDCIEAKAKIRSIVFIDSEFNADIPNVRNYLLIQKD